MLVIETDGTLEVVEVGIALGNIEGRIVGVTDGDSVRKMVG